MATLKVLYFAKLREDVGCAEESVALSEGMATVAALRAHLMARGDIWKQALAEGRALRVAVNREMAEPDTGLHAGDEVAFFPPVTGG